MEWSDGGQERICSCPTVSYWEDWGDQIAADGTINIGLVLVTERTGLNRRCPTHGKPRWKDVARDLPGGS